jgi:hypothetical protein
LKQNPVAFLTIGVVTMLLLILAAIIYDEFVLPKSSIILDQNHTPYSRKRNVKWVLTASSIILAMIGLIAYGAYRYITIRREPTVVAIQSPVKQPPPPTAPVQQTATPTHKSPNKHPASRESEPQLPTALRAGEGTTITGSTFICVSATTGKNSYVAHDRFDGRCRTPEERVQTTEENYELKLAEKRASLVQEYENSGMTTEQRAAKLADFDDLVRRMKATTDMRLKFELFGCAYTRESHNECPALMIYENSQRQ